MTDVKVVCPSVLHGSTNQLGTPMPCFVCGAPLPGPAGTFVASLAEGEVDKIIRERVEGLRFDQRGDVAAHFAIAPFDVHPLLAALGVEEGKHA